MRMRMFFIQITVRFEPASSLLGHKDERTKRSEIASKFCKLNKNCNIKVLNIIKMYQLPVVYWFGVVLSGDNH